MKKNNLKIYINEEILKIYDNGHIKKNIITNKTYFKEINYFLL